MGAKKQGKHFTVMVVPHSERSVVTFRFPIALLQILATIVAIAWLGVLVFVTSYTGLVTRVDELTELRGVNREQRAQIQSLVEETTMLRDRLASIAELERQVREMVDIEEIAPPSDQNARLTRIEQAEPGSAESQSTGGAEDDIFTVAGIVGRQPLEQVFQARAEIAEMSTELESHFGAMEKIRIALEEHEAYLAARPSMWPTHGIISSSFGYRRSPFGWAREFHSGLDIAAPHGTPIMATGEGVVIYTGWKGLYGNTVKIDHGYDYVTLYAHCSRLAVEVGEQVSRGDVIAYVGSTGRSTGPHVHYEVRVDATPVDPKPYLDPPE